MEVRWQYNCGQCPPCGGGSPPTPVARAAQVEVSLAAGGFVEWEAPPGRVFKFSAIQGIAGGGWIDAPTGFAVGDLAYNTHFWSLSGYGTGLRASHYVFECIQATQSTALPWNNTACWRLAGRGVVDAEPIYNLSRYAWPWPKARTCDTRHFLTARAVNRVVDVETGSFTEVESSVTRPMLTRWGQEIVRKDANDGVPDSYLEFSYPDPLFGPPPPAPYAYSQIVCSEQAEVGHARILQVRVMHTGVEVVSSVWFEWVTEPTWPVTQGQRVRVSVVSRAPDGSETTVSAYDLYCWALSAGRDQFIGNTGRQFSIPYFTEIPLIFEWNALPIDFRNCCWPKSPGQAYPFRSGYAGAQLITQYPAPDIYSAQFSVPSLAASELKAFRESDLAEITIIPHTELEHEDQLIAPGPPPSTIRYALSCGPATGPSFPVIHRRNYRVSQTVYLEDERTSGSVLAEAQARAEAEPMPALGGDTAMANTVAVNIGGAYESVARVERKVNTTHPFQVRAHGQLGCAFYSRGRFYCSTTRAVLDRNDATGDTVCNEGAGGIEEALEPTPGHTKTVYCGGGCAP